MRVHRRVTNLSFSSLSNCKLRSSPVDPTNWHNTCTEWVYMCLYMLALPKNWHTSTQTIQCAKHPKYCIIWCSSPSPYGPTLLQRLLCFLKLCLRLSDSHRHRTKSPWESRPLSSAPSQCPGLDLIVTFIYPISERVLGKLPPKKNSHYSTKKQEKKNKMGLSVDV